MYIYIYWEQFCILCKKHQWIVSSINIMVKDSSSFSFSFPPFFFINSAETLFLHGIKDRDVRKCWVQHLKRKGNNFNAHFVRWYVLTYWENWSRVTVHKPLRDEMNKWPMEKEQLFTLRSKIIKYIFWALRGILYQYELYLKFVYSKNLSLLWKIYLFKWATCFCF